MAGRSQSTAPTVREGIAFRYIADFRCIGAACEDTCCGGWRIGVDREHFVQLERAMVRRSPAEAARFRDNHLPVLDGGEEMHAELRQDGAGRCGFLDDGLCSIHRDYGETLLSNTCAVFPRTVTRVGGRIELTGTAACPEVARRMLLSEDAMELVDHDPRTLPRLHATRQLDPDPARPWERYYDDVRQAALALLGRTDYPLDTRLFALAFLANEVSPFFRRDSATEAAVVDRLADAIERYTSTAMLDELHGRMSALRVPAAVGMMLVDELLAARLEHARAGSVFGDLVARVADGYRAEAEDAAPEARGARVLQLYEMRRQPWRAHFAARLDRVVANYAMNHWLTSPYTESADLTLYVQDLAVRIAVLRFLLLSHPDLAAAWRAVAAESLVSDAPSGGTVALERTLDRVVVEVFYKFARAIDHSPAFLAEIARGIAAAGVQPFALTVMLLKF